MDINNLEYPYQSLSRILIQNLLNHPLTLVKGLIGYVQQDISLNDLHTTKYRINELKELMDAYTSKCLTYSTSVQKLRCLNIDKQPEREYKSQQKGFIYHSTSQNSQNQAEISSRCLILNTQN